MTIHKNLPESVKAINERVRKEFGSGSRVATVFEHCFPNTLLHAVESQGDLTYVVTGDIPAMWLRDSTAQIVLLGRRSETRVVS